MSSTKQKTRRCHVRGDPSGADLRSMVERGLSDVRRERTVSNEDLDRRIGT